MRPDPNALAGENVAQVTIEILTDSRPVYLTGIRVTEPRRDWLNLQIPPLEAWSEPLLWLTPWQRDRIESAEFYDLLQQQIQIRYRRLFPSTSWPSASSHRSKSLRCRRWRSAPPRSFW